MLEWIALEEIPSTKRGCKGQVETRVEQAVRTCTNVKNYQTKEQDAGVEMIEKKIEEENLLSHKLLLIRLRQEDMNPSIRGLIANRLMAKYQRPVAILTDCGDKWMGSARGYDKSSIKDFRTFCLSSGLINDASGHPNAHSLSISKSHFNAFVAWSDEVLKDEDFSCSYLVDFIYQAKEIKPQIILELGDNEDLWGQNLARKSFFRYY